MPDSVLNSKTYQSATYKCLNLVN